LEAARVNLIANGFFPPNFFHNVTSIISLQQGRGIRNGST
jgi:hypothetical protein